MSKKMLSICVAVVLISASIIFAVYYFSMNDNKEKQQTASTSKVSEVKKPVEEKAKEETPVVNQEEPAPIKVEEPQPSSEISTPKTEPNTKVLLPIHQRIQENSYYCVPACLQMVLNHHGITMSQERLAIEMNTSAKTGTEYEDLKRVANKYIFHNENVGVNDIGYHVQTIKRLDTNPQIKNDFEQRVKQDMKSGDPVFVAVDLQALYPNLPTANHVILVTGYVLAQDSSQIAKYYYIDPYHKVQDETYGGLKIVTSEELIYALVNGEEPAYIW
ncbi:MAG: C39 family peptidase [Longicatena sp.]